MLVRGEVPRYMLFGDKGSFIKYGLDVQEEDLRAGFTPAIRKIWGTEPEELHGTISTTVNGLNITGRVESETGDYRDYYTNICRAVKHKEEVAVTPLQARNVIRLLELANESSREKRTIAVLERDGAIL
jgi:predicted dehydrogenase